MNTPSPPMRFDRHPVLWYFLLVTLFSWSVWLAGVPRTTGALRVGVVLLGAWAPTLVAVALTARTDGVSGVRRLVGRLGRWQVPARWYLVALGTVPASVGLALAVHVVAGGAVPALETPGDLGLVALPLVLLVNVFVGGPLAEELGWRGYALPRLSARLGTLPASLVVGVVWAGWHLPFLLVLRGTGVTAGVPLAAYVPLVLAWSVLLGWLVAGSGGSVLLAVLFHAAANTTLGSLGLVDTATPGLLVTYVVVQVAVVVLVVVVAGRDLGRPAPGWVDPPTRPDAD